MNGKKKFSATLWREISGTLIFLLIGYAVVIAIMKLAVKFQFEIHILTQRILTLL